MKKLVFGVVSLAFFSLSATTYFVAPEGTEGAADAAGYGTAEKPFATLAYAYMSLKNGADLYTHNEIVLLRGTHQVSSRISNGMLNYGVIRGETGDPEDVTLDFGERAEACLLLADIQLRDVTVIGANADVKHAQNGSEGGALRMQSTNVGLYPSMVSNCVFRKSKACAVALTGPGLILDSRFEDNALENVSGKYHSLVYATSDGSVPGLRLISGCVFTRNSSSANGTCVNAGCIHSPIEIRNCQFANNTTTGGNAADVFVNNSAVLSNSVFTGASATGRGGSVYLAENARFEALDCRFASCRATATGGVLYLQAATGLVARCTIEGNESGQAGGFARVASYAKLRIEDSVVRENAASSQGGVIFADVTASSTSRAFGLVELVGSTFEKNVARCDGVGAGDRGVRGGGVVSLGAVTTGEKAFAPIFVDRCVFRENETPGSGGAIYMRNESNVPDDCRTDIRNSLFANNKAGANGGAINLVAYNAWVDNCTFVNNLADASGPNFYHRWTSYFRNCIVVGEQGDKSGTFSGQLANPTLYQNSIQAGRTDSNMKGCFTAANNCVNLTAGEIDQLAFKDLEQGDYTITGGLAKDAGQMLGWMSDAADCQDLAGNRRISKRLSKGGLVDIGCYELLVPMGTVYVFR